MTRIILDQLSKTFPAQPAPVLTRLSLTVEDGELLALLGPSGSGKSTILKLIAGIEEPDCGDIRFDERSILDVPASERGAVLMFQRAYLFPFLSVADNIGFGLKMQHVRRPTIRAEVGRMLELVGLPGIERRYPEQLSGGQQQRVALARALVVQPRVLLLDEPLSSLDSAIRLSLQEVIRRVQRELGITTLLVTHDLGEAVAMSDRTALLLDGQITACDTPQRLFQRPPSEAAARFVGISTFVRGRLDGAQLDSGLGRLRVAVESERPRQAVFAIRPEHLRLLDAPASNSVPGTVRETIYKGEFSEYIVALADQLVRVRCYHSDSVADGPSPGATVQVQFLPEHLFEVTAER